MYHGPSRDQHQLEQMLKRQNQKEKKKQKKTAYHKRRKIQQAKSSIPCEYDFMILHSAVEIYEEEYCCNEGADESQNQQLFMARKAKEDVYKDDFSSDDDEKGIDKSK